MKKALLLCTNHNDLGLIRSLRKLGYYIVATGNKDNSPGEKLVDKWIKADYSNKELILEIAQKENVDVICPCCNDLGVCSAAFAAEKMGLPGHDSFETTLLLHNKDKFKEFARLNNLQSPISKGFRDFDSAYSEINNMQFPVIVKPIDCCGGTGVSKVMSKDEVIPALKYAFSSSKSKRIVVEQYIIGTQHGFCTYLLNKKVVAFCSNDEYSIINPYHVEIDTYPSDNWKECSNQLIEQIEKIADLLSLKDGIFHLQYIYSNGKPWIIEVMRRVLGNMYSVPANLLNGFDWDYWEVRARCGLNCTDFPQKIKQEGYFAYKGIKATENGKIADIIIPENYQRYIYHQFMLMKPGDEISDYTKEFVGFLFMMFTNPNEMKKVLIDSYRCDLVKIKKMEQNS